MTCTCGGVMFGDGNAHARTCPCFEQDTPDPTALITGYRVTYGELERACAFLRERGWGGLLRFDEAVRALVKRAPAPSVTADPTVQEFRREVVDKLSVAMHCGRPHNGGGRTHREIVIKQCEDFLVEQFESALGLERQQHQQEIARHRTTELELNALVAGLQAELALVKGSEA